MTHHAFPAVSADTVAADTASMDHSGTFFAVELNASAFGTGLALPLARAMADTGVTDSVPVTIGRTPLCVTGLPRPTWVALADSVPAGAATAADGGGGAVGASQLVTRLSAPLALAQAEAVLADSMVAALHCG